MVTRITGLSGSGFDTEGTILKLMTAQRAPVDKLIQQRQTYEWQRDAFREINTSLTDFRNNKLSAFKAETTFNAKSIAVTGNTDSISAKATASATNTGSFNISVTTLATAAANHSTAAIANTDFDPSKTLSSQSVNLGNGTDLAATYKFKINNSEVITVDPTKDSLNDVISRINKTTNVTAFYDTNSKKISFSAKETGLTNGSSSGDFISFSDTSGNFLNSVLQVATNSAGATAATNANLTINGLPTTRSSNKILLNGIEVTLQKAGGASATISPATDTDKIIESVKTFIKDYNAMLKTLNDKASESKNRDYAPLTDAQKESLSETQIESWEKKAKAGLLRNDPILTKSINALRSIATTRVDTGNSAYSSLADLGIKTGDYSEKGTLYMADESKLRAAIEADPDAVKTLFTGDITESGTGSEQGIAERMYDQLKPVLDSFITKAGLATLSYDDSAISKQINILDISIYNRNKKLVDIEDAYYAKFSRMEEALNSYMNQSNYLTSQFNSGS